MGSFVTPRWAKQGTAALGANHFFNAKNRVLIDDAQE
jgi:hypothetical protein